MALIFKTLLRNKSTSLLMALQIAITLAVLVNALALVKRSQEITQAASGMDDSNIIAIRVVPFDPAFSDASYGQAQLKQDLDYLRRQPGVVDASVSNSFPGDLGSNNGIAVVGASEKANFDVGTFTADDHLLHTLGVELIAGRNFTPEEIFFSNWPPADKKLPKVIILTDAAAKRLFADKNPLGKTVAFNGTHRVVIGITGTFRGRNPILGNADSNAFLPGYPMGTRTAVSYLVRVQPGTVPEMMKTLDEGLLKLNDGRDIDTTRPLSELVARGSGLFSYGGLVLLVISALLVFTTALGIFGVAYFSVTKRTRQIGVRRALGATRANILKYYVAENLMIAGLGVVVGSVLAIGLNIQMTRLGLGRTDYLVTGFGILFVVIISQMSVLVPAWKASLIDPAIATRC